MVSDMPRAVIYDRRLLAEFELVKETVTAIRSIRQQKNIPNKEPLELKVVADGNYHPKYDPVVMKMANLSSVEAVSEKDATAPAFMVKTTEYFVPMGDKVDTGEELRKLGEELAYLEGFLGSVMKKLSNERFVQSAPPKVVETEQAKKNDAEVKIKAIKERMQQLTVNS
jgi:valyl-tRNA synthetase